MTSDDYLRRCPPSGGEGSVCVCVWVCVWRCLCVCAGAVAGVGAAVCACVFHVSVCFCAFCPSDVVLSMGLCVRLLYMRCVYIYICLCVCVCVCVCVYIFFLKV